MLFETFTAQRAEELGCVWMDSMTGASAALTVAIELINFSRLHRRVMYGRNNA